MADTFNLLPLAMETKTAGDKKISVLTSTDPALMPLMQQINALTMGFKQSGFALEVPPPPPQSVNPNRSKQVEVSKKQGNDAFKANNWGEALKMYSLALDMAASRPPWEPAALASDEMSVLLCNRAAAFFGAGLYAEAYADATACIDLKKSWVKGYLRKSNACVKLGRYREAKEVIQAALVYEPLNENLKEKLKEVEDLLHDVK